MNGCLRLLQLLEKARRRRRRSRSEGNEVEEREERGLKGEGKQAYIKGAGCHDYLCMPIIGCRLPITMRKVPVPKGARGTGALVAKGKPYLG